MSTKDKAMRSRSVTIDLQPWAYAERPCVLIELADEDRSLALAAAIGRAGSTVGICQGPDANAEPGTRCPLHQLQPCVAVEGADLVVTALDLGQEDGRGVLRGLRMRYPRTPLVVEATVAESLELGELLSGCTVVPVGSEPERVADAVRAALPAA
jgi:hypothetical protein